MVRVFFIFSTTSESVNVFNFSIKTSHSGTNSVFFLPFGMCILLNLFELYNKTSTFVFNFLEETLVISTKSFSRKVRMFGKGHISRRRFFHLEDSEDSPPIK